MGHEESYINHLYNKVLKRINKLIGHDGTTASDELDRVGKWLFGKKTWKGAIPKDMIPTMNHGDVCIVNTHESSRPGEHWLALARSQDELLGYDSFGRQLGMGIRDSDLDAEQIQIEKNCGQRCLAWLCIFKEFGEACMLI